MSSGRLAAGVAALWLALAPAETPPGPLAAAVPAAPAAGIDRADLFDRLDRLAALYRDHALRFTCEERIVWDDGRGGRKIHDLDYIYVFDEREGFLDYRTERRATWRRPAEPPPVDPGALGLPTFLRRAYSWVFLFERGKRGLFRYAIADGPAMGGRPTLQVTFTPVPPYREELNDWFGTAWFDRDTLRILRVEAMKEGQRARQRAFERHLAGEGPHAGRTDVLHDFAQVVTTFAVQPNGLALPERAVITRSRHQVRRVRDRNEAVSWPLYTVTQTYRNYRFFGVRTTDDLDARPPALPPP